MGVLTRAQDWCEKLARQLCVFLPHYSARDPSSQMVVDAAQTDALLSELKSTDAGLDTTLSKVVPHGVAFHHAGVSSVCYLFFLSDFVFIHQTYILLVNSSRLSQGSQWRSAR